MPAKLDVMRRPLFVRKIRFRVFQKRVQLKTYVAVVAAGLLPNGQEQPLRAADEQIGQVPGNVVVRGAVLDFGFDFAVQQAGLDQVGNDDRVRGGAGDAERPVALHEFRVDGVEPDLGTGGYKRFDGFHFWASIVQRVFFALRSIA